MSTFDLAQKVKIINPNASSDSQYGPYNSIGEALTATENLRELGRTVGIIESGIITEYWFKEGILDTDLILKESGGGIESVTGDLVDNTDPANPIIETPTLQQVTDAGATTTNPITVGGGLNQVNINDDGTIDATSNITGGKLAVRNTDGKLGTIFSDNLTDDREHQLQDKNGTLAHLDDIQSNKITNEDWTLIIDEDNVIWSNITGHTEYFKANGTDKNFVADFDFATIDVVYVNGVAIERNDYLILAENEIEIKENITLLNNTSVAIQGSIFIVEPTT